VRSFNGNVAGLIGLIHPIALPPTSHVQGCHHKVPLSPTARSPLNKDEPPGASTQPPRSQTQLSPLGSQHPSAQTALLLGCGGTSSDSAGGGMDDTGMASPTVVSATGATGTPKGPQADKKQEVNAHPGLRTTGMRVR
jgi:hypothetical protein